MSIARITISGTVYRTPEKRFTGNNIPVTTFSLNVDDKEPFFIRVIARGNIAETLEKSVVKGNRIVVEGRLQITTLQSEDGKDKKVTEVDLSGFELLSSDTSNDTSQIPQSSQNEKPIVEFSEMEMSDTLINEEEIPF